ncbi:DUF4440 domain-containing protein [Bacillus carboniphilus]|uniref:DUF4440 domain-containing protein n=1 Tax=Bacillus carboniphilus TaxID=86663 RepID=A0ABY9JS72_9BACI|nr:DUF4440 domain-containing protein [Bacillus carboniphilus]WLR42192.1 DUF4440 domain-containing protein [Bacillus carboniphilus]
MEKIKELEIHLQELEEKLLRTEIRSSQIELKKLLADDFFEIGSSGRILYKGEEIGVEGIGEVKMTMSDFEIHPLSSDIILATYVICNEIKKEYTLRSSIWKRFNEGWKMVFHQGTKTNDQNVFK